MSLIFQRTLIDCRQLLLILLHLTNTSARHFCQPKVLQQKTGYHFPREIINLWRSLPTRRLRKRVCVNPRTWKKTLVSLWEQRYPSLGTHHPCATWPSSGSDPLFGLATNAPCNSHSQPRKTLHRKGGGWHPFVTIVPLFKRLFLLKTKSASSNNLRRYKRERTFPNKVILPSYPPHPPPLS